MFKVNGHAVTEHVSEAENNYVIQRNDLLQLEVFTNNGEKIIDPEFSATPGNPGTTTTSTETKTYLVDVNGKVKFPAIDEIKIDGLNIRQAEQILETQYKALYVEPFVKLTYKNKRVTVLGATGGLVVPLANENMRLTEVLALAKGIPADGKAHNIRVLRGDEVFVVDFSTVDGYLKQNLIVQPNDVIYVEPVRRPFSEGLREYGPVISIITSIGTFVFLIIQSQ